MREPSEPKRRDPLLVPFVILVLVLLLVGAGLALRAFMSPGRPADPPAGESFTDAAKRALDRLAATLRQPEQKAAPKSPPPQPPSARSPAQPGAPAPAADPRRSFPAIPAPGAPHVLPVPANGIWTYDVSFGPAWQKGGQLVYHTQGQDKVGANMSWTPNGGKTSTWSLGMVEADHPTHANTRFPGFFMHAAYLPTTLAPGARLLWEFPWQDGDGRTKEGRVRQFDVKVAGWERVQVPAGTYDAARLEGTLRYVEDDQTRAEVSYTLWYSAGAKQVVRLMWFGRSPDEGSGEMLAELSRDLAPN